MQSMEDSRRNAGVPSSTAYPCVGPGTGGAGQERKKLRRLKRQERTQEIRDKIRMGILQPPPPKAPVVGRVMRHSQSLGNR